MKEICANRKAYHDYEILDTIEAGIALTGSEIKSIRAGKVSLKESYVSFVQGEAFLKGANISIYKEATYNNHDETRDRKLLLHKSQIKKYANKCKLEGLTCIPLKLYFSKGRVKVGIALARGKSLYDKRESAKKKDMLMAAQKAQKY